MTSSVFRRRWGIRLGVFALLCAIGLVIRFREQRRAPSVLPISPAITQTKSVEQMHADWQKGVRDTIAAYDQDHEAARARDALLALTVASRDQAAHLQLVLGLNALAEGAPGAKEKWKAAKQAFLQQQNP